MLSFITVEFPILFYGVDGRHHNIRVELAYLKFRSELHGERPLLLETTFDIFKYIFLVFENFAKKYIRVYHFSLFKILIDNLLSYIGLFQQ